MNLKPTETDEEWHEREGVPRLEDAFIQQFLQGRDALIDQEDKQRSDRAFRENLSPIAMEAAAIVAEIREEEQQTLWTGRSEGSPIHDGLGTDIYPGMMFSLARERMEKSKLFKIVKQMPKGALLHCHFEAMLGIETILADAFELPEVYLISEAPLSSPTAMGQTVIGFSIIEKPPQGRNASIWTKDYVTNTPIPLDSAADSYPDGGRAGFIKYMQSRCTITPAESLQHYRGPNEVWRKFLSAFVVLRTIIYHPPIFRKYIWRLCEQLHSDNVLWVDLRGVFYDAQRSDEEQDPIAIVRTFDEVVEEYKASEKGKGFWGMRIIWTWPRAFDKRSIIYAMKQCIKVKLALPHLIAGFDLVGQEEMGRPLADLLPELFWFRKACVEAGVQIPFFLHAGETLGTGDSTDLNLFDAVLLGTRRIGHGYSLFKHPLLVDMVRDKKILVESCPVSNEVLRLTSGVMGHPLPALLAKGVPVAICNDDPAILGHGHAGLSHDYWQVLQGWESLGLDGLGSLAESSVRYAAFEDQTNAEWLKGIKDGPYGDGVRAERMQEWMKAWEGFCLWIVTEFGGDNDDPALLSEELEQLD